MLKMPYLRSAVDSYLDGNIDLSRFLESVLPVPNDDNSVHFASAVEDLIADQAAGLISEDQLRDGLREEMGRGSVANAVYFGLPIFSCGSGIVVLTSSSVTELAPDRPLVDIEPEVVYA